MAMHVRLLRFALLVLPLLMVSCGHKESPPPAVSTAEQIRALPPDQKRVRCIDIQDAELRVVAERLKNLDYLYLNSESPITDSGAAELKSLTSLRQLVIENASNLTNASTEVFASLPALEELMVDRGEKLTDAALRPLAGHSNFRIVYLIGCPKISPAAVKELQRALPNCEIICKP